MADNNSKPLIEKGMTALIERIEDEASEFIQSRFDGLMALACLVGTMLLILMASPLLIFIIDEDSGKAWSETVKNVIETGVVFIGLLAGIKWIYERRDRATDVLLDLSTRYQDRELIKAAANLEKIAYEGISGKKTEDECRQVFDPLLRFYVVLYGIVLARQIPEKSLSICFRYRLAFYFHAKHDRFREHIDTSYPTLKAWLTEDLKNGCAFFRPKQLFGEQNIDSRFFENISVMS